MTTMIHTIAAGLVGVLAGAVLTYGLLSPPDLQHPTRVTQFSRSGGVPSLLPELPARVAPERALTSFLDGAFSVGERAEIYETVAQAGLGTLTAMAKELWKADISAGTEFAIDIVFGRMAEINFDAAINVIKEADLDTEHMLTAALAVVASRGVTAANMNSILAALPKIDKGRFETDALRRLGRTRPDQAMAIAVGLRDQAVRTEVLREVASAWAARDFDAARATLGSLGDEADRGAFQSGLMARLSDADAERVLLEATSNSTPLPGAMEAALAAQELAKTDPRRAIELADRLVGEQRETALAAAMRAWATEDPYGALALIQRLGPGRDREILLHTMGEELGRQDAAWALSWFDSLETSPQGLYGSILRGISQREPQRALRLALDSPDPSATGSLMFLTSAALRSGNVPFADLTERVLAQDGRASRAAGLQMFINAWAVNDPDDAARWIVSHSEDLGHDMLSQAALTLARQDPQAAMRYTQLLPAAYREEWISAATLGYAQSDLAGAKAWIDEFRGESVYDAGMTALVQTAVLQDPAGATAMLASFTDADARNQAATTIAQQWIVRQPRPARNWATSLSEGPLRDAALTGMMMMSDEVPDEATLALFASDQARQQAVLNIAFRKARDDIEDARALVERHIGDPRLRAQAEQMFEKLEPVQPGG